jgi:type II secretory pathway pseudopilin PulG
MALRATQRGAALLIATLILLGAIGAVLAIELASATGGAQRDRVSDRALARAREALIAYAADRPINAAVGPGYLPCPDVDNDGWAEATCGSLDGASGQAERLGRLPWKTLGIEDLRDGAGERLWYAVSSKYKGLLNCGASRACVDMSPDAALGTITVRDASGTLVHDGTIGEAYRAIEGGAVAIVIAPGPRIARIESAAGEGADQARECAPGDCDALGRCLTDPPQRAATCNPANYLDKASGARFAFEDNAFFVDRNDAAGRARNRDGFIHGPVVLADGRVAVNDRLAAIGYRDVMPRIMGRVALEVAHCLREHAAQAANAGRLPWPTPVCAQSSSDAALAWQGRPDVYFGRIADTPFASESCQLAAASQARPAWWTPWRPYVFYALARNFAPSAPRDPACGGDSSCLELADPSGRVLARGKKLAVIVAGAPLARGGFVQSRGGAGISELGQWLEESNAQLEGAAGCPGAPPRFPCEGLGTCNRITAAASSRDFNDVVVTLP